MRIKNNTNRVVAFKNKYFNKEIAIGDTMEISNETHLGDYDWEFSFFSFRGEKSSTELKFERGIKGYDLFFETESCIPLITNANVEGYEELTLSEYSVNFMFLYWKYRITHLRSVAVHSAENRLPQTDYAFYSKSDKVSFILRAAVEGIAYMLLAVVFAAMFIRGENMTDYLILLMIGACFLTSAIRRIIYLIRAKRWRVAEGRY